MNYQGFTTIPDDAPGTAVLICNLGTPEAPTPKALKTYLKEFLSDPRVVEAPRWLWWLILNGIILNTRPRKSAAAYREVWTEQGSPLMIYTRNQATALQALVNKEFEEPVVVDFAMRYGNPSMSDRLSALMQQGIRNIIVLPLYPQYSGSTSGSTFDTLGQFLQRSRTVPDLTFIHNYHDHPAYIKTMSAHIQNYWQEHGRAEKLILSYHGTPVSYRDKGDPYYDQCMKTSQLLQQALELSDNEIMTTFQSRFGKAEWLQPYTDKTMMQLGSSGIKSVQVFCPGFSSDCLETIEEIDQENREYFLEAGGQSFNYIPALNDTPAHIQALLEIIQPYLLASQQANR
ncbi:ferrochelatase [Gynuella sunshinyii]|uniref:Ferrochelatase n=1 Tax=Gynuella sunshinyii YC6258 TaxID=1445510 RepID=A0A0C5VEF0_9GAMM|nr:ferrochelatase [Gynuella sunshinyii]AJQ92927.1 protoheme ferro-lyase (ferrochelatase) [Gynuella sunshinyii YC6258]